MQPEELEVGTKLLIFVYLTLSEYTFSRSIPHGVQHDLLLACWHEHPLDDTSTRWKLV